MIVRHRAHRVESAQIVLVRDVVAVPSHDIERRVVHLSSPQSTEEFADQYTVSGAIFVMSPRRQKITRVGKPVGTNRTQIRQFEGRAEVLAYVAAGAAGGCRYPLHPHARGPQPCVGLHWHTVRS